MISVLILTRNEAEVIEGALRSVDWSDDVHVLDSSSTDGTQNLARALGATVTERSFDGYASQRNFGLKLPFRNEWIFILDADERPSSELSQEMLQRTRTASAETGAFRLLRRDFFWGRWLKHAQITPSYVRLVRRGSAQYVREVNEVLEVNGAVEDLKAPLLHYPFSKGLSWWIARHNTYSTMEATLLVDGSATANASWREALFGKTPQSRRIAQKAIFYKVPFRPAFKWVYMVLWRRALLDGIPGVTYATLQSIYEYFIEAKRRELLRQRQGLAEEAGELAQKRS